MTRLTQFAHLPPGQFAAAVARLAVRSLLAVAPAAMPPPGPADVLRAAGRYAAVSRDNSATAIINERDTR